MRRFCIAAAGFFLCSMLLSGSAFARGGPNHATGASHHVQPVTNNGRHGGTPHGWSEGKKKGWHGGAVPPGQAKKSRHHAKHTHHPAGVRGHDSAHPHPRPVAAQSNRPLGKPSAAIR